MIIPPQNEDDWEEWADTMLKPLARCWVPGTRTRAIAKALSYRLIGSAFTILTAYLWTGDGGIAWCIGATDSVLKLIGYYAHERLWAVKVHE